jgi:hypothetical protein
MVGENVVWLDIAREYPKLHPVFNVSLLAKYRSPNQVAGRGMLEGIKEGYYDSGMVVDWSKLCQILDARLVTSKARKGKFEFLLCWRNSTPGEDTWVLADHIPVYFQSYTQQFLLQWRQVQEMRKKRNNR